MIRNGVNADINYINDICSDYDKTLLNTYNFLFELQNKNAILLVDENEEIRGFLYALNFLDNIDLMLICVKEKYRNKGVGNKLIKFLIDNYAIGKTITLEVSHLNDIAIKLYSRLGFKTVNIRKEYYQDGTDAIVMQKSRKE